MLDTGTSKISSDAMLNELFCDTNEYVRIKEEKFRQHDERSKKRLQFPTKAEIAEGMSSIKINANLSEFNGKLYIDPKFGFPKEFCRIDGVTLNGKFEVETFIDEDEYVMKFIDNTSGNHICIYFNTLTEKMKFSDMVYSDKEIIQTNTTEFNVAENLNNNVLYKTKKKIREEKKEEFKTNNPKMVARAKKAKVVTGSILAAIAGATAYVLTRQKDSK